MMLRLAILLSVVCCTVFAPCCHAQTRGQSRSYNQSATGQGSFGQGGRGAFGGPTGTGQGAGGAGFGTSAFGSPGAGFGGQGAGGFGAFGGQTQGNGQVGAGLGGADAFIGNDGRQTQNFFNNLNRGQRRTAMMDFMIENLNEMRDRGRGNGQDRTPPVRVKLRPQFETPLGTMGQIDAGTQSRLATSATELGVRDPRMSMSGRTLVLEGKVATAHDRDLAEEMMKLEPGVGSVDNRLTVEPEATEQ